VTVDGDHRSDGPLVEANASLQADRELPTAMVELAGRVSMPVWDRIQSRAGSHSHVVIRSLAIELSISPQLIAPPHLRRETLDSRIGSLPRFFRNYRFIR
jgi:hypothetical protein